MVEDVEVLTDQSNFSSSQALLQGPPTHPKPENKKKKYIIGGSIGFIVLIILLVSLLPKRSEIVADPTPSPSPTPRTSQTPMKAELDRLRNDVTTVNPEDVLISPPQVDMVVEF